MNVENIVITLLKTCVSRNVDNSHTVEAHNNNYIKYCNEPCGILRKLQRMLKDLICWSPKATTVVLHATVERSYSTILVSKILVLKKKQKVIKESKVMEYC